MKTPDEIIKHDREDCLKEYMGKSISPSELDKYMSKAIDIMKKPRNDCISRQSLLNKLDPLYKEKIKIAPDNMAEGFTQVSALIKREPPVTPISIPDGATNGDMFLKVHPEVVATIIKKKGYLFNCVQLRNKEETIPFAEVYIDWWDAPYQQAKDKE